MASKLHSFIAIAATLLVIVLVLVAYTYNYGKFVEKFKKLYQECQAKEEGKT